MPIYPNLYQTLQPCPIVELRGYLAACGLRAGVGADLAWPAEGGLDDAVELLVPVPFDALYPHYLCAKLDAALGETERYAGEQARYNSILAELSAWLRRRAKPKRGAQWRW